MAEARRVGRLPGGGRREVGLDGRPVHERYDALVGLLERRLGPRHARLFARPIAVEGGREIEWWCECPGAIVAAEALTSEERAALDREHDALAGDVLGLANELEHSGDPRERKAARLLRAALPEEGARRVRIGDQPVLLGWGLEPAASAPADGTLEKPGLPLPAAPEAGSRWPGLPPPWLGLLLLAGLAPLLTSRCSLVPEPLVEAQEEAAEPSELASALEARLAERDALRFELDQLRLDLEDALAACVPEPLPEPVASAPPVNECDVVVAPGERPQVVFVLDASRSMLYPDDLPPGIESEIQRRVSRGDWSALAEREHLFRSARGNRMGQARDAVGRLIAELPPAVDVGLVQFGGRRSRDCGVRNHGFFSAGQRGELLGRVEGIAPDGGTALGSAIAEGGRLLARAGPDQPAVLVILTDGGETCGKDPCATSRALKRAIPGLEIVVIDISDNPSLTCIAAATGGKVLRPDSTTELADLVESATLDALRDPRCREAHARG